MAKPSLWISISIVRAGALLQHVITQQEGTPGFKTFSRHRVQVWAPATPKDTTSYSLPFSPPSLSLSHCLSPTTPLCLSLRQRWIQWVMQPYVSRASKHTTHCHTQARENCWEAQITSRNLLRLLNRWVCFTRQYKYEVYQNTTLKTSGQKRLSGLCFTYNLSRIESFVLLFFCEE